MKYHLSTLSPVNQNYYKQNYSMILQRSLRIEYNGESLYLMVKTFLRNSVYYFFISDKERGKSLLAGEKLQLTYTNSFDTIEEAGVINYQKIPFEIVRAIENMLLENKQLWYY